MSQDSIINSRLWKWFQVCSAWGVEHTTRTPTPAGWVSALNALLDNAFNPDLQDWDSLEDEQEDQGEL